MAKEFARIKPDRRNLMKEIPASGQEFPSLMMFLTIPLIAANKTPTEIRKWNHNWRSIFSLYISHLSHGLNKMHLLSHEKLFASTNKARDRNIGRLIKMQ